MPPVNPPQYIGERISSAEMRALVFSDNREAQSYYARVFAGDIRKTAAALVEAFNAYQQLSTQIPKEERPATVLLFVHAALNATITSLHLLVSGYPVPAGNLMRQYAESVAMAMLCAAEECNVYERYAEDRSQFAVHKSLSLIQRKENAQALIKALRLNRRGFDAFAEQMKFFDNHSHASVLTLSYHFMFTPKGGLILGSQVDPTKRAQYKAEIKARHDAAMSLVKLVKVLRAVLLKGPDSGQRSRRALP